MTVNSNNIEQWWDEYQEENWNDYFDDAGWAYMFKQFILEKMTVPPKQSKNVGDSASKTPIPYESRWDKQQALRDSWC